ncbi:MAG: hypothetical protein IJ188_02800 [Clostridia bacterium]|nr:hypothetical protein [Clostridia bacterium]
MRTLPQWAREEREKLRGYSPRDKMKYIWQYYRLWLIGIAAVVSFVSYALWTYFTVPKDIHFYGIFSNTYAQLGKGSDFYEGFVARAGYDLTQGVVELDCASYCKPSSPANVGNTYYDKLISMLDGGVDDVWVAEAEDLIVVGAGGRLMDLSTAQAAALREKYQDRFIYCTPLREDYSTEPVPIGIDLAGTALTGEYCAYPEGAALGINAYTSRLDQVEIFLDYLFERE